MLYRPPFQRLITGNNDKKNQKIQHKGSYYRLALEGGDIGLY
jgi:hypothetical protein